MFESIMKMFKKNEKKEETPSKSKSKEAAKERLHLVLMQDRANVSVDFLELMKQEIIDVIKKYIEVDDDAIDVRLTNKENVDGTNGAPALYANIPIINIRNDVKKELQETKAQEKAVEKQEKKATKSKTETKKQDKKEEKVNKETKTKTETKIKTKEEA